MRKMFLIAVASCALLAIAPATALAKHHSRRGHHARVHHKKFGTDPASGTTTPVNTAPATLSVVSLANGVLTISDANGQQIMGTVTPDTRLICLTQEQPPNTQPPNTQPSGTWQGHDHGGWGGDNGFGPGQGGDDQGQGDDEQRNQCTTADLMSGTPVKFADLSMSSAGTNWDVVVLETQPSTVPTVPDTDNDGD
jgi:hypothetical protein